jgi:hypothetical protein
MSAKNMWGSPAAEPPHGISSFIKLLSSPMFFLLLRLSRRAAFSGSNGVTFFVGLLAGETHNVLVSHAPSALQQ